MTAILPTNFVITIINIMSKLHNFPQRFRTI